VEFINAHLKESIYLKKFPIEQENFIVISGCSGGGKSTLIAELSRQGFLVVQEPGRQIVKEQMVIDGDALPWLNFDKFLELALSRYVYNYNSLVGTQQLVFFDRSIVDALQYTTNQPEYFKNAANQFRYNSTVFLVPPWEELYANDAERKHDFNEAKKEFEELLIKYADLGYEIVLIPKVDTQQRVKFILKKLGVSL
jgi:predicted ATPase